MGDYKPLDIDRFLDKAEANRRILRKSMAGWCSAFQEITMAHSAVMTPGIIRLNPGDLPVSLLLANMAFAYFAGAVDLGLSGHLLPCFALQRLCIESIAYAYVIMQRHELAAVWMRRDDSPEDKRKFDAAFKITDLIGTLPDTGACPRDAVLGLYRKTISYGGHPNPEGALTVADIGNTEERAWVNMGFFTQGLPLAHALKLAAEVGFAMVYFEDLMFDLHFAPPTLPGRIGEMGQEALRELGASRGDISDDSESNT